MTWVAAAMVASAGIAYAGSQQAAKAAEKAGDKSSAAAKYAADIQQQQYNQTRQDQAPWRGAGELGLGALAYGLGLSPTGYLPGMSDQASGAFGQNALAYGNASKMLAGSDQWEVVTPPGHRQNMQVRNTVTGEVREVPLSTERDTSSLKREGIQNALANGWQVSGTESVPQVGSILTGPTGKPTADQIATAQQQMAALSGSTSAGGSAGQNGLAQTGMGSGQLLHRFGAEDFQADPGYAFRQQQGQQGVERSAAARGGLLSGAALKGIDRFNQDLATQEYQNAYNRYNNDQSNIFNRLASMAGIGQTANSALQAAGQNYGNQMTAISQTNADNQANALLAAGGARASGYQGVANAFGNALAYGNRQPAQTGYQVPAGYQMGTGYLGNAAAAGQGYQPLDYGTYNSMGGFYD